MQKSEVQEKCDGILSRIEKINNDAGQKDVIKEFTTPLKERVETIKAICSVEKYNLCFIGNVGVGKTTAISHLFGLIDRNKLKVGNKIMDIPFFKTASGRTTLCETEVVFTNNNCSSIVVVPMEEKELKDIIKDICSGIVKTKESVSSEDNLENSIEIIRAIGNMAGIKLRKNDEEIQKQYVIECLGEEKLNELGLRQALEEAIYKKMSYSSRVETRKECPNGEDTYYWIKNTLGKINDGKDPAVPYPAKLILELSKKELKQDIPDCIGKIIDTRGLENGSMREDIVAAVNDINNICIICDKIPSYGRIVMENSLKNEFIKQKRDLKYRTIILGLEQAGELFEVNGAEGNRERGKDLKKDEAIQHWDKLCLDEKNMLFYQSLFGIDCNYEKKISQFNMEEYDNERENVLKNLIHYIQNIYDIYNQELTNIEDNISCFVGKNLGELHRKKLLELKKEVSKGLCEVKSNYSLLLEELTGSIQGKHPGYVRGAVNRNGEYWNLDIYFNAKNVSYEEYDNALGGLYFHLSKECKRIFKDDSDSLLEVLGTAINYKIDTLYNEKRNENAQLYYEILKREIYYDPVWREMQGYWGNSDFSPYRVNVSQTLECKYKEKGIKELIEIKNISKGYIEDLIKYLTLE